MRASSAASIITATPPSSSSPTASARRARCIAGGRYDGLIESLGGPHTPAVGWAAGIERLAMMIEAPAPERVDRGHGRRGRSRSRSDGVSSAVDALRRAGHRRPTWSLTGAPRKRYDKATKVAAERRSLSRRSARLTIETPGRSRSIRRSRARRSSGSLSGLPWYRRESARARS